MLFTDDGKQVDYKPTPNKGGKYEPQYLIMHYTAATSFGSSLNWFLNKNAQASAHLLIGRDGAITQFAPFNIVTWHAGKSHWENLQNLNQYAIGIELVNAGRLIKSGGKFISQVDQRIIPDDEVVTAKHKNDSKEGFWQQYTQKQLEVALEVAATLVNFYKLKDVLGHEDIAPIRKSDPGPAFPMSSFKSKAMGRKGENTDEYVTSSAVNIRAGAGTNFDTLSDPLPKDTKVLRLKTEGTWSFVEVHDKVHGIMDLEGWVSSKFLVKKA